MTAPIRYKSTKRYHSGVIAWIHQWQANFIILDWPLLTNLRLNKATDGAYTFIRASAGWVVDHEKVWQQCLTDEARFTGGDLPEPTGYLQEPQRTNKCENYNVIGADLLGSELFSDPTIGIGWTDNGDGTYTCDGSNTSNSDLSVNTTPVRGSILRTSVTVISYITGDCKVFVPKVGANRNAVGTYDDDLVNTSSSFKVGVRALPGFIGTVGFITIKEIGAADVKTGTFVGGKGTGAKAFVSNGVWINPWVDLTVDGGSGDDLSYIEIIEDFSNLNISAFAQIAKPGKVLEIYNSAGSGSYMDLKIIGGTNNTNKHIVSCVMMSPIASNIRMKLSAGATNFDNQLTTSYSRVVNNADTPGGIFDRIKFVINPGEKMRILLNQLEEGHAVTTPIVCQGTAGGHNQNQG